MQQTWWPWAGDSSEGGQAGGLRAAALICLSGPRTLLLGLIALLAASEASLLTAPPQFLETPPQVLEVRELEPITLRCVARGSPQPRVTWKLRGQDLGQGQGPVQVSPGLGRVDQIECEGQVEAWEQDWKTER